MIIIVSANDKQWKELTESRSNIDWIRVEAATNFEDHKNADAFFYLESTDDTIESFSTEKPVFVGSVVATLKELKTSANVIRINGWSTFLNRNVWEIAGEINESIQSVLKALKIKFTIVADEPGFISARIIAMIINEAYFAIEEKVSTKNEIDTAMKLGTNYPYGPFEWANLIGEKRILSLLQKLNESDIRYQPAALLIEEAKNNS